jgi:hypothetical protein
LPIQEFGPGQHAEANPAMPAEEQAHPALDGGLFEASTRAHLRRPHSRYFEDLTGFLQPA